MEILEQEINRKFNNKYSYLKLLEVEYDKTNKSCLITFLFPFTHDEPNIDEKKELEDFVKSYFKLFASIKLKYKKSFLDSFLVKKEILNFFETNNKLIFSCISEDNITTENFNFDVNIKLEVNSSAIKYFNENQIQTKLVSFLNTKFIGNFFITVIENNEILKTVDIDDIEFPSVPVQKTMRYEVDIMKKIFGGDIEPKPEYISNVKSAKTSVIFAGVIENINRKEFIIKKGKKQGETKAFYTFNLKDEGKSIESIYFCPKSREKLLDSLENGMYVLCTGDVQFGFTGKLTYYIKKMSLALPKETLPKEKEEDEINIDYLKNLKQVVEIEKIVEYEQDNLFVEEKKYNKLIEENNIVVFDLETTGLDSEVNEIIEIGAVKIKNGVISERFSSFSKPDDEIPDEVIKLTGITNEMVSDAPKIENVINDFYNFTKGCILSGHNVLGFDIKFVRREGDKLGLNFDHRIIDTLVEARTSGYKFSNFKLGTICKELNISLVDAHRAWNDALATAKVLLKFNEIN